MRYNLSMAYIETEQYALAMESLTELVKIDPEYWDAYYHLGNIMYRQGDKEAARGIFRTLLEKQPSYSKRSEIEKLLEG